jgi:precorrin-2/cobalt-factor-2 C20-methyltransferase
LAYPVTTEIDRHAPEYAAAILNCYDKAAEAIAAHLDQCRSVAVLCEGDPMFYGSYMHLHRRLAPRYETQVVAGVSGMAGCWSALGRPMAQGDDVLVVVPGTLPPHELERWFAEGDAIVVMKLGRNLRKVRQALDRAGRLACALYVERGTMPESRALPLSEKMDNDAPYFAMVLVPGWESGP